MRLLLDSHILLWWPQGSPRLGARAAALISSSENELFMSAASWWELGLKCALGKLDADLGDIRRTLRKHGVVVLPITVEHGEAAAALTMLHRDPFDHLLVAQALAEGLRLLTRDRHLAVYGPGVLWV